VGTGLELAGASVAGRSGVAPARRAQAQRWTRATRSAARLPPRNSGSRQAIQQTDQTPLPMSIDQMERRGIAGFPPSGVGERGRSSAQLRQGFEASGAGAYLEREQVSGAGLLDAVAGEQADRAAASAAAGEAAGAGHHRPP
jgi:hypothetical protein